VIDAVIRTGGKQYRVHEGSTLNVATIDAEPGSRIELRDVLLVSHEGTATVGTPIVDGAVVVAEVVEHGRGPKVINFKYKAKVRYRRKRGHRQAFTTLSVREITANGVTVKAPEPVAPPEPSPPMDMSARPAGFAGRVEAEEPAAEATDENAVAEAPAEEPVAEAAAEEPTAEAPAAEPPKEDAATAEETPAPRPRRRRRTTETESNEDTNA
jgi:large subunit ribosomal protein L21